MVKTPRTRHSKSQREPVTIDLEAEAVRRDPEEDRQEPQEAEAASEMPAAEEAPAEQSAPPEPEEQQASSPESEEAPDGREEAAAEEPGPEPVQAERPAGGGAGRALAAGVAGGVIALLLGGALQWANVLPVPARQHDAPDPAVEALRQQVETVRNELAQLRETAPAGASDETVEQALAGPRQEIAELRETVSGLEQAVSAGEAGQGPGLEALDERISELESRLGEISPAEGGNVPAERVAGLEADLSALRETAAAARETASANTGRLEELAGRLDTLAEQVEARDEGPRLALVVAASALRSAVERGQPFASELETYSALTPDSAGLEPLRQYAESGIPTRVELAEEAPEVASRIVAATSAPPADAGFLDRLMASARSAVTVRPVGEVEGDAPEAIAARMEAAVERGDYAAALAEYEALPPAAQEAAADFAEKLRARQAADEILENALSSALKPA